MDLGDVLCLEMAVESFLESANIDDISYVDIMTEDAVNEIISNRVDYDDENFNEGMGYGYSSSGNSMMMYMPSEKDEECAEVLGAKIRNKFGFKYFFSLGEVPDSKRYDQIMNDGNVSGITREKKLDKTLKKFIKDVAIKYDKKTDTAYLDKKDLNKKIWLNVQVSSAATKSLKSFSLSEVQSKLGISIEDFESNY